MTEVQLYSMAEVAKNNGKDGTSIWMVYKDSVYDVTKYVNEHPGGDEAIITNAGKDGTKDFRDAGHSSDAVKIMSSLKIGELIEADRTQGKRKIKVQPEGKNNRSCFNIITCGLVG